MNLTLLYIPELFGLSIEVYIICFLIGGATFFICNRLLKKIIKANKTRNLIAWIITLTATPLIYLGLISLLLFAITYTPSRDFDRSQWLANKDERYQMANDIINTNMMIGKDKNDVKQILGEPTSGINDSCYLYDMGFGGGGLGFLFHKLVINFREGKVVSVEHITIRD